MYKFNPSIKDQIGGLKVLKAKLENNRFSWQNGEIQRWMAWDRLPGIEKQRIVQEWEDYYVAVLETKAAKEFKNGKMGAGTYSLEIQEPSEPSGEELQFSSYVTWYIQVVHRLNMLSKGKDVEEEVKEIFGMK